ncbi:serine/threonine-protein kinase [Nocardia macrotermitis]|uniref:non-specific serine/threonine protein kinase n=1 Tax=Nocardia macrotermitis TaxID=2585198 RepID=A0A7K0CYU6_9NOCA|nr:serine/threonine-protein kinase [Nocardia macrotermitis]MQY17854.1 Serine/threonine-protein kinase PknK [Nocardia macrotermitis]
MNARRDEVRGTPEESNTQQYQPVTIAEELGALGLFDAEEIGRGGFGVVYRCVQKSLSRTVAVKVLSAVFDDGASEDPARLRKLPSPGPPGAPMIDAESRERFLREEHAMGRLSGHPNIVDVLQVDVTASGMPCLVMPYAVHGSLEQLVRDNGPLSWSDTLRVGVKLAGAIESAHRVQVLHRDVKPANVLLSRYGEPQLTDFGIARIPGGFRTSTAMITGSPAFTAPEVLKGQDATVRSDVYGLGATLFALLTGHAAYERQSGEKIVAQFLRITTQPVPDLRAQDIPADVAAAIEQAMSVDPDDRPASALEFGELLRAVQHDHGQQPDEMALLNPGPDPNLPGVQGNTPSRTGMLSSGPRTVLTLRSDVAPNSAVPPTAATKFRPPTPTREPLSRPRLLEMLRAGDRRRLAFIHGPAGFGKSTLAAQWQAELAAGGNAVAWIGIDRDDDNEVWLLAHLVHAIRRVCPDIGAGLEQVLEERSDEAVPYAISTLIDEIHAAGRTVVVIIEDWHRITDAGAQRAMDTLLDNGCHHLRFVITARERAGLPLSRLRVRDELVEIGAVDLRLTPSEMRRILVERNGFELTETQLERIGRATGGWPAAIALVGLALRARANGREDSGAAVSEVDTDRLIGHLSERNEPIGEYLAENVLDALEPRMLKFLMSLSATEKVCGSLAAAVSGEADAEDLLEQACSRELFVRRLDHDPGWFRLQPLFAEQLRTRLERESPGASKSLHRKASRWYAEHQLLRKSVDHALAATDLKLALDLLEGGGMDLIDTSKLATLLGSVSKLPVQQVATRSKLMLALARANINLQQSSAARTALGRVSSMLARTAPDDADTVRQRCEADVLAAADLVARDRTDGVAERVSDTLAAATELPAWTVSTAANLMSYLRLCDFDFDGVRDMQEWARPYHARSKEPLGEVLGLLNRGAAAYEQLDIDTATTCYERAWQVARDRSGPRSHAARAAAALLGEVRYRRGDLDAAEELLDESHQLVARVGPADFMITTFVIGSRVKSARGDTETAAARLIEGARLAADRRLPRLAAHIRAEQLRLGLALDAPTPLGDKGLRPIRHLTGTAALTAEAEELAAVRALLARGAAHGGLDTSRGYDPYFGSADFAPLGIDDSAVKRARALYSRIVEQHRPRAQLDTALLLAECLCAAGWTGESIATLTPVVVRCAELGWRRPLLDAGPRVLSILHSMRNEMLLGTEHSEITEETHRFLNSL